MAPTGRAGALVLTFWVTISASVPACDPVRRPAPPKLRPLPAGALQPHFVSILVDDLGYDDTSVNGNPAIGFTPQIHALMAAGIKLDRHHTYKYCSPTRRAFLSGRYPTHITGTQAPQCSNLLPLQFTTLSEKLLAAGYESHFIGKGHLGYQTVDHLPANRGFESHVGYLGGGESYKWGGAYGSSDNPAQIKHHDMWHTERPGTDLVDQIEYSTSFYSRLAVSRIEQRNTSRPLWLHLAFQAVHAGDWRQSVPPQDALPANDSRLYPHFQDQNYGSATHSLDDGVGNITDALKDSGMWDNTLIVLTSDNGGDCGLPANPGEPSAAAQPGSASNYPLLGRKCTAFEGGTRVAAFISGGKVPPARRGTVSNQLVYITDWYPTFCILAGVDPSDDYTDPSSQATHPIDGVDVWPALAEGADGVAAPVREWLPTTEVSLLWNDGQGHMWKLVTAEFQTNRFHRNGTQYMDPFNACISPWSSHTGAKPGAPPPPGLGVPPSCYVCTNSTPCVFDVLADPLETKNVAAANPDVVTAMTAKLAGFNDPYVLSVELTPANLACYNCTGSDSRGIGKFGDFWGPCCTASDAK